jgi:hypothetical protein
MTDAWPHDGVYGFTPDGVRAALAAGGDPNGQLGLGERSGGSSERPTG